MGLYILKVTDNELRTGVLEKAKTDTVDYEKDFENWLENSPNVLLDEEEGSIIWIGRQVSASVGDAGFYPDLIGIDTAGDLVIVELKKGKTPREVIAQIMEYAAWGSLLTYDELDKIAREYNKNVEGYAGKSLRELHQEAFFADAEEEPEVEFNKSQRLFIVAEEVSPVICQVVSFLRSHHVDISCMEYEILKSKQGEFFISTEKIIGFAGAVEKSEKTHSRWIHSIRVKDAIYQKVEKLTDGDKSVIFSPVEVYNEAAKKYPDINPNTVRCQIIQDCVNHTSRRHYPSGQRDLYYRIEPGKFRLYDSDTDGRWNFKGERMD